MPLDHYVTLGQSGLRVSPLSLGTMTFGEDLGWGCSVEASEKIIDRYIDLGGNFIDTANFYTLGHSEKIIGDHLTHDPSKRERTVLATKFFGSRRPGDPNAGGAHRKNIVASCESSLRRLRTDRIDLYWMHLWDTLTPIEETLRALDDLVKAGKVLYVGFSDTPAWKVAQAQVISHFRGWTPLIALQIEYSLLERTVEGELMPMARELNLGVTPWSPLKGGLLSGKYRRADHGKHQAARSFGLGALDERAYNIIDCLVAGAKELNSTPARVALAWLQAQPGVTASIVGARTVAQLEDNIAALEVKLPAQLVQKLSDLSAPTLDFPAAFIAHSASIRNPSTTVNGVTAPESIFVKGDKY